MTIVRASSHRGAHQHGVVLLSVLLILALLTALIYQLVSRHSLIIAQARQTFAGDQALSYALGGESFARQILFEDWSETGKGVDTLQEAWAQPLAPFEVDSGFLEVQIRDMNGCFNLNSLLSSGTTPGPSGSAGSVDDANGAPAQPDRTGAGGKPPASNTERFKTLLRNQTIPDSVADVWLDWIDADEEISGFGAEDGEYLLYSTPYRSANQLAAHLSELALLRDVEPAYIEALSRFACVLPTTDLKLNVNTASAAALAALSPSLSESALLGLTESTREYESVGEVTAEFPDLVPAVDALTVTSEYFEVRVRAQVDDNLVELAALLQRNSENGEIKLLTRNFGKDFRSLYVEETEDTERDSAT